MKDDAKRQDMNSDFDNVSSDEGLAPVPSVSISTQDQASQNSDADVAELVEKDSRAEAVALDPTRYGDWEKKGRCIDF